jgi:hypothetical protein
MKIKGLYEFQSHIWLYFQDSKLERVFPHLGENSMAFGISWLGGIDKNFRLTWFWSGTGFRCERAKLRRKFGLEDRVKLEPL